MRPGVQFVCSEGFPGRCGHATAARAHTDRMEPQPCSLAKYFDGWYADMTGSPAARQALPGGAGTRPGQRGATARPRRQSWAMTPAR